MLNEESFHLNCQSTEHRFIEEPQPLTAVIGNQ